MPLDTGAVLELEAATRPDGRRPRGRPTPVVLTVDGDLGAALRIAREGLGLSMGDIGEITKVGSRFLSAIEAFDFDKLPARPFVVGFVSAYARALGLDPAPVVARLKAEAPPVDGALRPPPGLGRYVSAPLRWTAVAAVTIAVALLAWNVSRQALAAPRRALPTTVARSAAPQVHLTAGPAQLGAPLPAPPEASAPTDYAAPGSTGSAATGSQTPAVPGTPFVAAGTIYGAPGAGVVLQARKATSLVVRGPDKVVYFARQLSAGEAWRAPALSGLTADAGNPASVEAFAAGVSLGVLNQPRTPLADLHG